MLLNIDPLLDGDILKTLRDMGHGDELVIADTNFPSSAVAHATILGRPLKMVGVNISDVFRAVLSVLPLDGFVPDNAWRMEVVGSPAVMPPVQLEALRQLQAAQGADASFKSIERMEFYERAKKAYAVLITGEQRHYSCFILKKGVVSPPDEGTRHDH